MIPRIKLDTEAIRYIGLFETLSGAHVKDCILNNGSVTFIVEEGHAGIAIGRNGYNIQHLQKILSKKIEIVEYSKDPVKFIVNLFRPAKMKNIYISEKSDGEKVIHVQPITDRGLVRSKLKRAKEFLLRYYGIGKIIMH